MLYTAFIYYFNLNTSYIRLIIKISLIKLICDFQQWMLQGYKFEYKIVYVFCH